MSACALLDLGKCLGPCVRPEAREPYRRAIEQALDLLEGRDTSLIERLAARRDQLADELRFEQAAELRDRIRELERLLGDQRRLQAVARRNLVVVAPSRAPDSRELFFIRAGRLREQRRVSRLIRADRLRRVLRAAFAETPADGPIERAVVDEMHQLEAWLRRERASLATVTVDPDDPEAALPALRAALRKPATPSKRAERDSQPELSASTLLS